MIIIIRITCLKTRTLRSYGHCVFKEIRSKKVLVLTILDDFRPGNLLPHLPLNIRSVVSLSEAAENKSVIMQSVDGTGSSMFIYSGKYEKSHC
jgi:hypothetical protein